MDEQTPHISIELIAYLRDKFGTKPKTAPVMDLSRTNFEAGQDVLIAHLEQLYNQQKRF